MRTYKYLSVFPVLFPALVWGMGDADPLAYRFMLDRLEIHDSDGKHPLVWEAHAWVGKDLNKLYLYTEGERVNGEYEELQTQLLYSRAILPYWDMHLGWRYDSYPLPNQHWLAVGVQGLAPYYLETQAMLYWDADGYAATRLKLEHEWMLTQRLALIPEVEMNAYSRSDPDRAHKAGLSDLSADVRLAYEIRREIVPYVGVHWDKAFGQPDDADDDWQWVAGLRLWF